MHFYNQHRRRFSCDFCLKFFGTKFSLKNHIERRHLKLRPFECKTCSFRFLSQNELIAHMLIHGSKTECPICHKSVLLLKSHLRNHGNTKCPICDKKTSRDKLIMHVKSHWKKQRFLENASSYSKMVISLAKIGNDGLRYEDTQICCLCQKSFANRGSLRTHIETFHFKMQMLCDLCPKMFSKKPIMVHHMKSVHSRKKFACNICDYKSAFKNWLHLHKMTHASEVECSICNKKVSSLKEHVRGHNKPKKTCPICHKSFFKRRMEKHMMTHTKKILICASCEKVFYFEQDLKR